MVDVRVHKALPVSVLGHPQDLGGQRRERRDGEVHVVPGGHGEQRGDLGTRRRGGAEVRLRTDETFHFTW